MKKVQYILFSLLFCFLTSFSQQISFTEEERLWIKNNPVVEFGYDPDWKPYEFYKDGIYSGIVGEYIQRIEIATGIDLVPIPNITWPESIEGLRNGTIHMVPDCHRSKLREMFLVFTEPFVIEPLVIITRRDFPFVGSFKDLNGEKVALPKEYWTNELIHTDFPGINVSEKRSILKCLEALSYGEVDAVIGSLGVISYYINNEGFTNLKVAAPADLESFKISMAFTKDHVILRDICQKVINTISLQERSRIQKDWISVRYEYAFNWTHAFTWLLSIVGIVLIVLLLVFLWNRALRKKVDEKVKLQLELESSLKQVQKSDQQNKVLLQEIHHRVKNNLQIISSLIRLQANTSNNVEVESSLSEAIERIRVIALIHENLYNSTEMKYISPKQYFMSLASDIIESAGRDNAIEIKIATEVTHLNLTTIVPLALILNELIVNSIKHAFKNKAEGLITIQLNEQAHELQLGYSDNGVWLENINSNNFGTSLIKIFTEQLEGIYHVIKKEEGTAYQFIFKAYMYIRNLS